MRLLILCATVCVSLFTTSCDQIQKQKEKAKASEELKDATAEMKKSMQDSIAGKDGGKVDQDVLDKLNKSLDDVAASQGGQEAIAADCAKYYMAQHFQWRSKQESELTGLTEAINYSKATTVKDIENLSEKVNKYKKFNEEYKEYYVKKAIKELEDYADQKGLKGSAKKEFLDHISKTYSVQLPFLLEIRDCDDQLCDTVLEIHGILKQGIGKWKWNKEFEQVEFEDADLLSRFNEFHQKIQEIVEKQAEAQQKVLSTF